MTYEFVPQFSKMLNNLSAILGKAQAFADQKKFDVSNLLNARLAPDQFNLTKQIQATCDMAKNYAAKLSGTEAPKHEDNETTLAELQERIRKTVQYLESVKPEALAEWKSQKVTNPRREGKFLPGDVFALQHSIPNFYFHFTTAYSILRNQGVDVGKKDYLGDIQWRDL